MFADPSVSTGLGIGTLQGYTVVCVKLISTANLFMWPNVSKAFEGKRCSTVSQDVLDQRHYVLA